jgi:radical SAM enzyme (TIGR01210 family)
MMENVLGSISLLQSTDSLNGAEFYKTISNLMCEIHKTIPEQDYDTTKLASPVEVREEYFENKNHKRLVMYLMSNGCDWALKNGNGCTICGHLAKQRRLETSISTQDYIKQFVSEYDKVDFKEYPILNLYNNGSILNNNEIPNEALFKILKIVNQNPYIRKIVLESRPEFVNEEIVYEIKKRVPDKFVEIAMGLEVLDDFYRIACINKGFRLEQFKKAATIIKKHLNLKSYVLLKPPFLTEREGIEEAIRTIEFAFAIGSSTVSLEACTIQKNTLAEYLSDRNDYSTPWLWSIVEVVKKTAGLGNLIVGMFQFYPSPSNVPYNCDKCSQRVKEAIVEYNRTLDIRCLDSLDCSCKEKWKQELSELSLPFEERLDAITKGLEL